MAGRFAVVEMQCFTDNAGHYILKELAIVSEEGVGNWVFLPPYDFETLNAKAQQTALWLTTQFHGLAWDSGDVSYGEVPNIISRFCAPFSRIYTKGLEKTIFLREFLKESDCCVINSEDLDSTIKNDCFTVSPPVCLRHTSKNFKSLRCALRKASLLYSELDPYKKSVWT